MKTEKKQDLRVLKTRKAIFDTFKNMVMEMDARNITIKELADRALIHRKTFYLHYQSIEFLYEDILNEVMKDYFAEIEQLPTDAPFTEINRVFFEFMSKQEPYIEKIVCDRNYRDFSERMFCKMLSHNRSLNNPYAAFPEPEQNIINTFLGTNSINIYRQWVLDKKTIPLERLIELSGNLFMNGIPAVA